MSREINNMMVSGYGDMFYYIFHIENICHLFAGLGDSPVFIVKILKYPPLWLTYWTSVGSQEPVVWHAVQMCPN